MIFAGATRDKRYDIWHMRAGFDVYAATPTLQLALDRTVQDLRIRLTYALGWVEAKNAYDYLTGIRNRTSVEFRSPVKKSAYTASMKLNTTTVRIWKKMTIFSVTPHCATRSMPASPIRPPGNGISTCGGNSAEVCTRIPTGNSPQTAR